MKNMHLCLALLVCSIVIGYSSVYANVCATTNTNQKNVVVPSKDEEKCECTEEHDNESQQPSTPQPDAE